MCEFGLSLRPFAEATCTSTGSRQAERDEHGYSKLTLGHEGAGVVDAVGPGVTLSGGGRPGGGVSPDRLRPLRALPAGRAGLLSRDAGVQLGARRRERRVRGGAGAQHALPLPDDFDFEDGALLSCNLGTGFAAARKARASGDMTLAVSGLGPVGLYTVMMARAMGASVIGIDVQPSRIELAEKLGIDATANAVETDPVEAMRAFSGGDGVHAAIDTSGNTRARTAALEGLRPHGIFVEVGIGEETVYKLSAPLNSREITLTGSWIFQALRVGRPAGLHAAASSCLSKTVIVQRCRIDDAVEAFKLADSATTGKIMFEWD